MKTVEEIILEVERKLEFYKNFPLQDWDERHNGAYTILELLLNWIKSNDEKKE